MDRKVYITQENPNLNYIPAEEFGEVIFLTRGDFSPMKNSLNNDKLIEEIRTKLKKFHPVDDYLVISGSPVVSAAVFMIVREITDTVNILRWSNRDRLYQHLVVSIKKF
jgi:folate-dependent tRNA-U54 methylase TrmFO/GidA